MGLGSWKEVLDQLENSSTQLGAATYALLLQHCGSSKALSHGKSVHRHIMINGRGHDSSLGFFILQMYVKCEALQDGIAWFFEMRDRSLPSWNYMMGAYLRHDQGPEALQLYRQMQEEGTLPDKFTFINAFLGCSQRKSLMEGRRMNACVTHAENKAGVGLLTTLLKMYGRCGDIDHAQRLFEEMPIKDAVTWNAMMSVCTLLGHENEAIHHFDQMLCEGLLPTRATFASILSACANRVCLSQGKQIHVYTIEVGVESEHVIANALVYLYNKCGSLRDCERTFSASSKQNVTGWSAMINAYAQHGCLQEAIQLFARTQQEGAVVEKANLISILDECGMQNALTEGKWLHAYIQQSGRATDITVSNSLISMYGRCGSIGNAQEVFDKLSNKDMISWNALIAAYAQNGHGKEALKVFNLMQKAGMVPDKVTIISLVDRCVSKMALVDTKWLYQHASRCRLLADVVVSSAFVNMFANSGSLVDARCVFDQMVQRNVVSWTAMISAYSLHGHDEDAIRLFSQMLQEGVIADKVILLNLICACTTHAVLDKGKTVHVHLKQWSFDLDTTIANALVNMYGKCGSLDDARQVLDKIPMCNVATWNALIAVYAQHGQGGEALHLFNQMQHTGVAPDRVTFVNILTACNHVGSLEAAFNCFLFMDHGYSIIPTLEHYDCVLDMLGRGGQLREAETLINTMPFQPVVVSWMALLGTCRNHADIKRAQLFAKHMLELDSQDPVSYVMLLNLYAVTNRKEDAQSFPNSPVKSEQQ